MAEVMITLRNTFSVVTLTPNIKIQNKREIQILKFNQGLTFANMALNILNSSSVSFIKACLLSSKISLFTAIKFNQNLLSFVSLRQILILIAKSFLPKAPLASM
jgi:hypothetical protein